MRWGPPLHVGLEKRGLEKTSKSAFGACGCFLDSRPLTGPLAVVCRFGARENGSDGISVSIGGA